MNLKNLLTWTTCCLLMTGCAKEDVALMDGIPATSPQVDNVEVAFNLFECSTGDIGSRAETTKSLAESQLYTELQLVLIAESTGQTYNIRQVSTDDEFGNVRLYVPIGKYQLVAIAVKNPDTSQKGISIKSATEATFPSGKITDLAYLSQAVTIDKGSNQQDCTLKRGVTLFKLYCTDHAPTNAGEVNITLTGDCGTVFNPSTGYCKETSTINRNFVVSEFSEETKKKNYTFSIFAFLSKDETQNITVNVKSLDTDGKAMKTYTFKNVHLIMGKQTTYSGPVFNNSMSSAINISNPTWQESGYNQTFE